jgi:hypothetical protein
VPAKSVLQAPRTVYVGHSVGDGDVFSFDVEMSECEAGILLINRPRLCENLVVYRIVEYSQF